MKYVDGFVLAVPEDRLEEYTRMAKQAGEVWREHGALEFRECAGDDLDIKDMLPFPKLTNLKDGETVVFSWIVFESRQHRDEVNKKVMDDPRIKEMCDPKDMPFDCERMAYGGFNVIVDI